MGVGIRTCFLFFIFQQDMMDEFPRGAGGHRLFLVAYTYVEVKGEIRELGPM